ncbi:hemoglobin subunit beta-2-like isoform X2 [Ambystoma mexicanum]|uniref:hemoglobin subunit beta-2-like isoform X2 n=1 Tax=Ambystoma mexicanum TaxID=8296 RepID=UPI0037E93256
MSQCHSLGLLLVSPWTRAYFSSFGNLSNGTAIRGNVKVRAHGAKVLGALGDIIKSLKHVKRSLSNLSQIHFQKLHVDPQNFHLLCEVLVIVLAQKLGAAFSPQVQATWEKFLSVVAAALSQHYQ